MLGRNLIHRIKETFKDIVGYGELQELAERAMEPLPGRESEEERYWIGQLQRAGPRRDYLVDESMSGALDDDTSRRTGVVLGRWRRVSSRHQTLRPQLPHRCDIALGRFRLD